MKNIIYYLYVLLFTFLIKGCTGDEGGIPEELIRPKIKKGEAETSTASKGGVINVDLGGFHEPNSVYIDLSTGKTTSVRRDAWQLGFYNGAENRVFLNASVLVTAAKTEFIDISKVSSKSTFSKPWRVRKLESMTTLKTKYMDIHDIGELIGTDIMKRGKKRKREGCLTLGYQMCGDIDKGISFTDSKQGTLDGTALGEIAADASSAKVFIISAGSKIPSGDAGKFKGGIATTMKDTEGGDKGFYKIKVFMQDAQHYVIQYAQLDETKHKEAIIAKDDNYNLTFFSLLEGKTVTAAPPKTDFDINFAGVFSFYGVEVFPGDDRKYEAGITYSDYALINNLGGTGAYALFHMKYVGYKSGSAEYKHTDEPAFEDFTKASVEENRFIYDDQTVIDSKWRRPFPPRELIPGVYFIIKDFEGNIYKLKFTAYLSESKERGHLQFEYKLLK